MKKEKNIITIRGIMDRLFGKGSDLSGWEILDYIKRIFPDTYNSEIAVCDAERSSFYERFKSNNRGNFNEFIGGNIRDVEKKSYRHPNERRILLYDLNANTHIHYKSDYKDMQLVNTRESMLNNLKKVLKENGAFEEKEALNRYYADKVLYSEEIKEAIEKLYESDEEDAFVYLVFLLIVIAIFQSHVDELDNLTNTDTINIETGEQEKEELTIKNILKSPTTESLTDKNYQGEYFIYMQRPTYDRIYKKGKLSLKANSSNEYTYAILNLEDEMFMPHKEGLHPLYKRYEGETIFNHRDKLVYSIMTGVNGTIGIMVFRYDAFNYAGMLFRSAFFISSFPGKHVPVVQKMLISAKEIEDLDLIDGLLKIDSNRINIEKKALDEFIEANENKPWMKDFKESMLPYIQSHEKVVYSFAPEELYYNTLSELDFTRKIEVIELLKSCSTNSSMIECAHLDRTNRLIGDL